MATSVFRPLVQMKPYTNMGGGAGDGTPVTMQYRHKIDTLKSTCCVVFGACISAL